MAESQTEPQAEMSILFSSLVMMLSTTAMQQLGKLVNPLTKKTEVDLNGAQLTIDMLSMLQVKTRGNVTSEEARILSDVLSSLQLNYVETAQSVRFEPSASRQMEDKARTEAGSDGRPSEPEKKEPKFHKSYGS